MIRQLAGGGFGGGGFGGFGGASGGFGGLGGGGPRISAPMGQFQQAWDLYDQYTQNRVQCQMRNNRGECANPDSRLFDGETQMSWKEFDALKASGQDPYKVAKERWGKRQHADYWARKGMHSGLRW